MRVLLVEKEPLQGKVSSIVGETMQKLEDARSPWTIWPKWKPDERASRDLTRDAPSWLPAFQGFDGTKWGLAVSGNDDGAVTRTGGRSTKRGFAAMTVIAREPGRQIL